MCDHEPLTAEDPAEKYGGDGHDMTPTEGEDEADTIRTLVISGSGKPEATYRLETDGATLRHNTALGSVNEEDSIDGLVATGAVIGGADAYDFDGGIIDFEWDGSEPAVELDGVAVDPATLGEDADGEPTPDPEPTPEPEPEPEPSPPAEHTTLTIDDGRDPAQVVIYGVAPEVVMVETASGVAADPALALGPVPQCAAATGDGDRCSREADVDVGSETCWQHDASDIPDAGW